MFKKGFTLVELTVVVFIIGILAAFIIPNLAMFKQSFNEKIKNDKQMEEIIQPKEIDQPKEDSKI